MSDALDLLPVSALQHLLFCSRQCALIHLEQVWADNHFTAEGTVLHSRTDNAADEHRSEAGQQVSITRSLPVVSHRLGLSGKCDIVEFHSDGIVLPVEYKRGKPKTHRADEVQLCAQALCLEEMLGTTISQGHLFYGQRRRRSEITFDPELRQLTADTAAELHSMIDSRRTPAAVREKKCDHCSLIDLCLPEAMRLKRGAAVWFANQFGTNS